MAAPASPVTQLNSPAQSSGAKPAGAERLRAAPEDLARYRLHVVATNIADVVTSIGGLIFDRAMAGWDVTVGVDGNVDDRAIRILGARVATPTAGPDRAASAPRPHVLAVATDMFVTNETVRRQALTARKGKATDVLLWGRCRPPNLNCGLVPVRHRPSAAAHVFKSHALAALAARGAFVAELTEEGFYSMT